MKSKKYVKWSARELAILKHWYPIEGTDVKKRLKRRSKKAIQSKASLLHLTHSGERKPWTLKEELLLGESFEEKGSSIASELNRSRSSVISKAKQLGKCAPNEQNDFTEEEIKVLQEKHTVEELCKLLPRHTKNSIIRKRIDLGYATKVCRKWTDSELRILKKYYPIEGILVCKRLTNRTEESVLQKARKEHLRKQK